MKDDLDSINKLQSILKMDSLQKQNAQGQSDKTPITPQTMKSGNSNIVTPSNDKRRKSKNFQNKANEEKIQVKKLNIENPSSMDFTESKMQTQRKDFQSNKLMGDIKVQNMDIRHGQSMQYLKERQELQHHLKQDLLQSEQQHREDFEKLQDISERDSMYNLQQSKEKNKNSKDLNIKNTLKANQFNKPIGKSSTAFANQISSQELTDEVIQRQKKNYEQTMNSIREDIKHVIDKGIRRKQSREENLVIQPNIIHQQSSEAAEQYYVGGNSTNQIVSTEGEVKRRNKYLDEIN